MTYNVKDVAERYQVGENTVLSWIARGDLQAVDVSRSRNLRPKWRITENALRDFEQLRATHPNPPTPKRRRRKNAVPEVY